LTANTANTNAEAANTQLNTWKSGGTELTGKTSIKEGTISADYLSISAIKSADCEFPSDNQDNYTSKGSYFDLTKGTI
jgi:hypothetical protein